MIYEFSEIEKEYIEKEYEPFKGQMLHKAIDVRLFQNLIIAKAIASVGIFYHTKTKSSNNAWNQLTKEEITENFKIASDEYLRSILILPLKSVNIANYIAQIHFVDKNGLVSLENEIQKFSYANFNYTSAFNQFLIAFDKAIFNKLFLWCFTVEDIKAIEKLGIIV